MSEESRTTDAPTVAPTPDSPADPSYGYAIGPDELRLVAFGLGTEWYGLETVWVRGIEPETAITPVPSAPDWLLGVFNLRGSIVPVVDTARLLGAAPTESSQRLLLIAEWDATTLALRVDHVDEMYELSRSSMEAPLATVDETKAVFVQGQVRVRDRLIGVLNLPGLMRKLIEG